MSTNDTLKIIIAGGGIAGLTLAKALERYDIDYILLEAYHDIAPQVGASIGLFPNGLRIMDQLGCYEAIQKLPRGDILATYTRDKNGEQILMVNNMPGHYKKRHGYPMLFFDRQWLLELLYGSLRHKERVLLNKKIVKVEHVDAGVEVTTKDGDSFKGTLVIGADGIHSVVREEMFRIGNQLQPGYFEPNESDRVPCYYQCSFGIAQNVPGWVPHKAHLVHGRGQSQLVVSGPENKTYWFFFVRLPEVKYGKDIPSYTKEDEAQFYEKYSNFPITPNITFGQVVACRLSSALTPLHEIVYKKWFFRRIMIFGDSAHKPNPLTGQGGNGAIESVAEFINALRTKIGDCKAGHGGLSDQDIEDIFAQTQAARHKRAKEVVGLSHKSQALNAYEDKISSKIIWGFVAPFMGDELALTLGGRAFLGAARLKEIPIPMRPRVIPYNDELPAKPVNKTVSSFARIVFAAGMFLLLWASLRDTPSRARVLRSAFSAGPAAIHFTNSLRSDPVSWVYGLYLLSQHISPLLIYTIEGYRKGNQGTFLSLPSLFNIGLQRFGASRILPLHAVLAAFQSFAVPPGRFVSPAVAKTIIPSLVLASIVPIVMGASSTWSINLWQNWALTWSSIPILFSINIIILSTGLEQLRGVQKPEKEVVEPDFERYESRDVPFLKFVYAFAVVIQATAHMAMLASWYFGPESSPINTILGLPESLPNDGAHPVSWLVILFQHDTAIAAVAIAASNLYTVWSLRGLGYISTYNAIKAALGVLGGQLVLGPGATWAALWYWREVVLPGIAIK